MSKCEQVSQGKMRLQDLPAETLSQCFKHLSGLADSRKDLKASRLTSKRLSEIVAPILIHRVAFHISLTSLARLEAISQHSLIAGCIRTVDINLSFYDTLLAQSFSLFARCRASELYRGVEGFERHGWRTASDKSKEEIERDCAKGWQAQREWDAVSKGDHDRENLTPFQIILQNTHQEYCRHFDDQELAKRDDEHLSRISVALRRLTGLRRIVLCDDLWKRRSDEVEKLNTTFPERSQPDHRSAFSDAVLRSMCLRAFRWKGAFMTAETAPPPAQLIPDIFTALQQSFIFPSEFHIRISPPNDLAVFQMSSDQLRCISHVLRKATSLSFSIDSWARQDSLATDNTRPYSEIQHLGSLTCAFFDVDALESLELGFGNYPCFTEVPNISLAQILPLQRRVWSRLHTLALRNIPMHQHEVRTLAERQSKTVIKLDISSPYLLSGSWIGSVEDLRSFEKLEQVTVKYLVGGEFNRTPGYSRYFPDEEVGKYLLGEREHNPVAGFL